MSSIAVGSGCAARRRTRVQRVALRLGMALVVWSRREARAEPSREELIRRYETAREVELVREERWRSIMPPTIR